MEAKNPSWKWPIAIGVLLGIPAALFVRASIDNPLGDAIAVATARPQSIDDIVGRQLVWASMEGNRGVELQVAEIRQFFAQAREGTREFAEDALGFTSKYKLVRDFLFGGRQHKEFMAERFVARVFAPEQLEQLVQGTVGSYVHFVDDVDSTFLVRLQADLEGIPSQQVTFAFNGEEIGQALKNALSQAIRSVEADFRGNVSREVISYVAGEVMGVAVTELAVSAGILGAGASSGAVTFGVGLVVGVIVDCIVSWTYDMLYDPAGEISNKLNETLIQLETLIIDGDGKRPGLEDVLCDFATGRSKARSITIQNVLAH